MIYNIARRHLAIISRQLNHINKEGAKMKMKSTYACMCIVFSFLLFWLPYFIYCTLILSKGYSITNDNTTRGIEIIAFLNSIADPILFVLFRRDVKQELKKMFKFKRVSNSIVTPADSGPM